MGVAVPCSLATLVKILQNSFRVHSDFASRKLSYVPEKFRRQLKMGMVLELDEPIQRTRYRRDEASL